MEDYKKKIIYSKADNFGANFPISGRLQIINSFKDLKNVKRGHILFLNGLKFNFDSLNIIINLINRGATSFISTDISKTDHGCIAAKELGINFYQVKRNINKIFLYENKIITLKDCNIYYGKHNFKKPKISLKKIDIKHSLKLNIGFPSNSIYKNFIKESDGVGFSRVEFLLSRILNNIHPHKYSEFVGIKIFTDEIANHIRPLLKTLKKQNKEFWLRTDDFSAEQLVKMEFGKSYEIEEKISSTGYRGIRRSINDKKIITPVLLALKKLCKEGYHNIGLFPPMTNSIFEYKKWLALLSNYNLTSLKKGLMVETPRSALMIEEFLKDIKFVIFGTNDLTSFLLAVDRNNLNIREMFNEFDSVVIKVIGDVIKKCKLNNIETYITGSIAENKNLLKKFFSYGLTGVTINPDVNSINKVKRIIFDLEKKIKCVVFGVFSSKENLGTSDKIDINKGLKATIYRGPDDQGFYQDNNFIVGFNRLSIIDLNAKSQPHISENRNYVLVCNGEIYNFKEIKDQLKNKYNFNSNVDTEVLIPGYLEWKDKFWEKLNGMFSIVLYDKIKKITLIRDHAGIKPLHYFLSGNRFYFSNDYNAFYHQKNKKLTFNKNSVLSYLSFRYVIGENTFLKDVYDVLPGQKIEVSNNISKNLYWDLSLESKIDRGEQYYAKQFEVEFNEAIERQVLADVPVGGFISGGLDSSLILHYMKKYFKNIETFATGFNEKEYDELKYADVISNKMNLKINKIILNEKIFLNEMKNVISARGEPCAIPHETAFHLMSKKMRGKIKVVLSGEGADELLGGYGRLFKSPLDYYKKILTFSDESPMSHFLKRYSWFNQKDKSDLLNMDTFNNKFFDDYSMEYLTQIFDKVAHLNYFDKMYYIMIKMHLVNMLNRLDRMTMYSSIEARVPFLDKKLVEFIFGMPNKYKIRWKNNFSKFKSVFCSSDKISERLDIPKYMLKKIAKHKIDNRIIERKKLPFPLPVNTWLSSKLGEHAKDTLLSKNLRIFDFVNQKNIQKFLDKKKFNTEEDLDGKKIWMLLNLEIFLKEKKL